MNAVRYFEQYYDCKVDCDITFDNEFINSNVFGCYLTFLNVIKIFGCHHRQRNDLVEALFHELIHYRQYKVLKTLHLVKKCKTYLFCGEVTTSLRSRSLLNDVYHRTDLEDSHMLCFRGIPVNNYTYENMSHEIEARQLSKIIRDSFMKSNMKRTIITNYGT